MGSCLASCVPAGHAMVRQLDSLWASMGSQGLCTSQIWHTKTHTGLKAEARSSDPFNYRVMRMVTSKDDHRASLSPLVRTRFLPLVL